jgi:type IV secretory pathway VirJ component
MVIRTVLPCLIILFANIFCLKAQVVNPVTDLPLQLSKGKGGKVGLIIYLTGDGGWNSFNQQMTQAFEKQGYGVVALNTRKYFWSEKTPEVFAHDVEKLSNYYMKEWGKSSLIIVGYSFGADVASFLPNRLSVELKNKIKKIVLLSPSASTDFVIRLGELMGGNENVNRKYKVKPEIEKILLPIVCIFGNDEVITLKNQLVKSRNLTISELPGDHRYMNNLVLVLKMMGI